MGNRAEPSVKPLRTDARRNRDRVLAVAREMLASDGLSVSFDEIARRVGVGVGTVYRHFPTRNGLFEALLLGRIENFVDQARILSTADTPSGEAFRDYFAQLVSDIALNQALCEALDDETGTAIALPDQLRHDFIHWFDTLLSQAKRAGAVRPDVDIADVLDLLIGAATAERRARLRNHPGRSTAVVLDGLLPEQPPIQTATLPTGSQTTRGHTSGPATRP